MSTVSPVRPKGFTDPADTPYEGKQLGNWPRYTILRGQVMYKEGEIVGSVGYGRYLKRGSSKLTRGFPKQVNDDE